MYDSDNIFAKILKGELPAVRIYEDNHVLAFKDIHPAAPVHVLVITKKAYSSFDDFSARADEQETALFWRGVHKTTQALGLSSRGYRIVTNIGADGGQEVQHFHIHVLAGKPLGAKVCV
jgi:diadenosine tetraphosphate (Ap4A) HIT family hydrolase